MPSLPLRIALTGGIASGKSTAAQRFTELGVPVIDTDQISRELSQTGGSCYDAIITSFGPEVVLADGQLDRAGLRRRILASADERRKLEAILHPPIYRTVQERLATVSAPYAVIVIPLLLETRKQGQFDRIAVVDVSEDQQRIRLAARDKSSAAEIDAMLATQADRASRLAIADDILDNNTSPEALRRQVDELHERYLELAK